MKKMPLFMLMAFVVLSVTAFVRTRSAQLRSVFYTAVTVNGIRVYGNFTTSIAVGCGVYLVTSAGMAKTLFTVASRVKQAYILCN